MDTKQSEADSFLLHTEHRVAWRCFHEIEADERMEATHKRIQEEQQKVREECNRMMVEAREAERERKRERARRVHEAGLEAARKGK